MVADREARPVKPSESFARSRLARLGKLQAPRRPAEVDRTRTGPDGGPKAEDALELPRRGIAKSDLIPWDAHRRNRKATREPRGLEVQKRFIDANVETPAEADAPEAEGLEPARDRIGRSVARGESPSQLADLSGHAPEYKGYDEQVSAHERDDQDGDLEGDTSITPPSPPPRLPSRLAPHPA